MIIIEIDIYIYIYMYIYTHTASPPATRNTAINIISMIIINT